MDKEDTQGSLLDDSQFEHFMYDVAVDFLYTDLISANYAAMDENNWLRLVH